MDDMKGPIVALGVVILVIIVGLIAYKGESKNQTPDTNQQVEQNTMQAIPDADLTVTHTATIETSAGNITLELYGKAAPTTVESFVTLAGEGFYDDTRFHRVIENFMVQAGDPNTRGGENADAQLGEPGAWGTGGPDYRFDDELVPNLSNVSGTIAMANSGRTQEGRGTNGSQFFINVVDNTNLDGFDGTGQPKACGTLTPQGWPVSCHTVFGKVTEGLDIAVAISQAETLPGDRPAEDIVLKSISIK